jgi:hypothetical protein
VLEAPMPRPKLKCKHAPGCGVGIWRKRSALRWTQGSASCSVILKAASPLSAQTGTAISANGVVGVTRRRETICKRHVFQARGFRAVGATACAVASTKLPSFSVAASSSRPFTTDAISLGSRCSSPTSSFLVSFKAMIISSILA